LTLFVEALSGRVNHRFAVDEMDHGVLRGEPVHGAFDRESLDQMAENAEDAAMGDDHRGARERRAEVGDAPRDILVALTLRRPEGPETGVALPGDGHAGA